MAAPADITVRELRASDEPAWRTLWLGYCTFYGAAISGEVTEATWRRLVAPVPSIIGRVAVGEGTVVGFTHSILHECTWSTAPICYLEDLFVDPAARGHGAGRALVQDVIDLGRASGWSRIYWHTQASNAAARRLYDQFLQADDFVRYRLILP